MIVLSYDFYVIIRHAEHCHRLEKDKEQYVQEWQVGQTQVETLQKALEEHRLLLADKVG